MRLQTERETRWNQIYIMHSREIQIEREKK